MRKFGYLFNQQLNQMFISPSTYIAAFLFLAFMGVIYLYSLVEVSRGRGRTGLRRRFSCRRSGFPCSLWCRCSPCAAYPRSGAWEPSEP